MKIQIIGAGVVGQATGRGFARLGHEIVFVDTNKKTLEDLAPEFTVGNVPFPPVDVFFICVSEKVVEEVVTPIQEQFPRVLIVIRSTVPPGTAKKLSKGGHYHVCSNPEFLREAVAEYEFLNPPGIIIGECCKEHGDLLERLYTPFRKPIYRTVLEVAELTKLSVNGYLACQVSYWNQVKLLADKLGINSHEVGMLASYGDDRVSIYGSRMHGKAYGGKCLPKDLQQLIDLVQKTGVNGQLFEVIKAINDVMKGGE